MKTNLKVFKKSKEWLKSNQTEFHHAIFTDKLRYERTVSAEKFAEFIEPDCSESKEALANINKRTVLKLFLMKGYTLGAKFDGDEVTLFTPKGISPDRLSDLNKGAINLISRMNRTDEIDFSGKIIAKSMDFGNIERFEADSEEALKQSMIPSFLGRALYASKDLKNAVNARSSFKDRDTENSKGIAFLQVKPGANIVSSDHPDFLELKKDMDKEHFPILLKIKNIDGVYDKTLNSLAIHNVQAVDYIESYRSSDLVSLVERVEQMGLNRSALTM